VHDTDNLYVSGPSLFPSSGAVNPTFTLTALAERQADHLLGIPLATP
jgi:choline dehydrogenase-like flavoprotein